MIKYDNIKYISNNKEISYDDAQKLNFYVKNFYDEKGIKRKVEEYDKKELFYVQYYLDEKIADSIIQAEHEKNYGDVKAAIFKDYEKTEEGYKNTAYGYKDGILNQKVIFYYNEDDLCVREEEFSELNWEEPWNISEYDYDENGEMIEVREFDKKGRMVTKMEMGKR